MAALAGQALQAALIGDANPHLSSELDGYVEEIQTVALLAGHIAPTVGVAAGKVRIAPAIRRGIVGQQVNSYRDDFYFRIHISTALLDLGNILSEQQITLSLWNAIIDQPSITLNTIDGSDTEGLSLAGPALPFSFASNLEQDWLLTILPIGPFKLDTVLTWTFASGVSIALVLLGSRITVWTAPPDWDDGIIERLLFKTNVLTARTGASQRRKLRLFPRRGMAWRLPTHGQERRAIDALLWDFRARAIAVPIWPDAQPLDTAIAPGAMSIAVQTTGYDFSAGGLAVVIASVSRFEVFEIDMVAANLLTLKRPGIGAWPVGSRLWPLRTARLVSDPDQSMATDDSGSVSVDVEFTDPAQWPAITPLSQYLGWPVLELSPDRGEDMPISSARAVDVFDAGVVEPHVRDMGGVGFTRFGHLHRQFGRSEQSAMRSLLMYLSGRLSAVWVPSWQTDLVPIATLVGNLITIEWAGYTRFGRQQPGRRDIRIELRDGTVFYHRITASAEIDADSEQISIEPAVVGSIAAANVRTISFMVLSTLASDEVEIHHLTDSDGIADVALQFEAVSDEL